MIQEELDYYGEQFKEFGTVYATNKNLAEVLYYLSYQFGFSFKVIFSGGFKNSCTWEISKA